jgi:hypothetical protein
MVRRRQRRVAVRSIASHIRQLSVLDTDAAAVYHSYVNVRVWLCHPKSAQIRYLY